MNVTEVVQFLKATKATGKGTSYGSNWAYEELARNLVPFAHLEVHLIPLLADGIGIEIPICETNVVFDVLLVSESEPTKVFVCECKRRGKKSNNNSVAQGTIFEFAKKLDCLRNEYGSKLTFTGFVMTTNGNQLGAMKVATELDVTMALAEQDQVTGSYTFHILKYDPQTRSTKRHGFIELSAITMGGSSSMGTIRNLRADGTIAWVV